MLCYNGGLRACAGNRATCRCASGFSGSNCRIGKPNELTFLYIQSSKVLIEKWLSYIALPNRIKTADTEFVLKKGYLSLLQLVFNAPDFRKRQFVFISF